MAANPPNNPPSPPVPPKSPHVRVNMRNPTSARRVFYDGIPNPDNGNKQRCITLDAGASLKNVPIHRDIVREMAKRNRIKPDSDIIMTEIDQAALDNAAD